uniref:Uncharacterized protein n=1 Tax=Periophthalmus magnuspinnatus TaxID=409849 RepID=A0A3B4A1R5_9GOBI
LSQDKIRIMGIDLGHNRKEQVLEQLTKELRQVNLQQFIQQTGTRVTVLHAQSALETGNGKCTLPPNQTPTCPISSNFNPEGIYV